MDVDEVDDTDDNLNYLRKQEVFFQNNILGQPIPREKILNAIVFYVSV